MINPDNFIAKPSLLSLASGRILSRLSNCVVTRSKQYSPRNLFNQ